MSTQRLFRAGETLTWNIRSGDACWLRSMIESGNAPEQPVVAEVRDDPRDRCPVCGSTDIALKHTSRRIDEMTPECIWDGQWPHPQHVLLQNGTWWAGDWFT